MPGRVTFDFQWVPLPQLVARSYFMSAERAEQLEVPMRETVELFGSEIDMNFQVEGRPDRWADLADSTIRKRLGHALGSDVKQDIALATPEYRSQVIDYAMGGIKILQDEGTLYDAATNPDSWDIQSHGGSTVATLTDPTGYGFYHVEGTTHMPVRDFTYISDEALDEAEQYFADWVLEE